MYTAPHPATQQSPHTARWAERITAAWRKQVPAIIETGNLLVTAKAEFGRHGEWMHLIKTSLPFGQSTANKLMAIANYDPFRDSDHGTNLPACWRTMFELTRLSEEQFTAGIESGAIHPKVMRKDIQALRGIEPAAKKVSPMAILKRQLEEGHRKIAHLEEQLAAADAGSLFDLKRDSVKDIASVVVSTISDDKATKLADAIKGAIKSRRSQVN